MLLVSAQVEGRQEPCTEYRLGEPAVLEKRCITPVIRGPCAPPFACTPLTADGAASYPRAITPTHLLGAILRVDITNGGSGCVRAGTLRASPIGGYGSGFLARYEIAERGSFRGTSGAVTHVVVVEPGSGYQVQP